MTSRKAGGGRRSHIITELNEAARANSTATVLFHAAMAEQFGLSPTDSKTMDLLARFGPLTAGELVERTGLASPSVTALIDRLEAKGFARRVRDDVDRRRVIVELVPAKLEQVAEKFSALESATVDLWAPYTIEQLELIRDFLHRATAFISDYAARLTEKGEKGRKPAKT